MEDSSCFSLLADIKMHHFIAVPSEEGVCACTCLPHVIIWPARFALGPGLLGLKVGMFEFALQQDIDFLCSDGTG